MAHGAGGAAAVPHVVEEAKRAAIVWQAKPATVELRVQPLLRHGPATMGLAQYGSSWLRLTVVALTLVC